MAEWNQENSVTEAVTTPMPLSLVAVAQTAPRFDAETVSWTPRSVSNVMTAIRWMEMDALHHAGFRRAVTATRIQENSATGVWKIATSAATPVQPIPARVVQTDVLFPAAVTASWTNGWPPP